MAWTDPKTYKVEEAVIGDLNTYQRDNIIHLHDRDYCIVTHSADQNATIGAFTSILFNTEVADPDGMHSTVSNTSRISISKAGVYVATAHVFLDSALASPNTVELAIVHSTDQGPGAGTGGRLAGSSFSHPINTYRIGEWSSGYLEARLYIDGGSGTNVIKSFTGNVHRSPYLAVAMMRDAT